jgi:acyl dehydratase
MAINRDYVGRTFAGGEPYEVSRVKIAEFADAIGDPNPLYRDRAAAQAAGYPDVIAPPTFAIVISMASTARVVVDPGLGVNYAMVVHGEQRFEYSRPIHAGDVVTAQSTITEIRDAGRNALLTAATEIRTVDGEHVCTAHNTLVDRGGAA